MTPITSLIRSTGKEEHIRELVDVYMQIERIFYPIKTLGPGKRVGIWTIGCRRKCRNCSNPELWSPNPSKDIFVKKALETIMSIKKAMHVIDGITITGGEPFLQLEELSQLVSLLKARVAGDILLYTGFTIEELWAMKNAFVDSILTGISVLIDGPYVDALNDDHPLRGSSNQRVLVFDRKLRRKYEKLSKGRRAVQNVYHEGGVIHFGIPLRAYEPKLSNELRKRGVKYER